VPIEGFSLVASVSNKPPAVFSSASAIYNQIQITNYCETSSAHTTMKHGEDYTRFIANMPSFSRHPKRKHEVKKGN
jgi:hypothetical protein